MDFKLTTFPLLNCDVSASHTSCFAAGVDNQVRIFIANRSVGHIVEGITAVVVSDIDGVQRLFNKTAKVVEISWVIRERIFKANSDFKS